MTASTFGVTRPPEEMITVEDAQARVLAEVARLGAERIALDDALGRVLREDVVAPRDVPQGDNSAMDGYAVRASDTASASDSSPVELAVIGDLAAGSVADRRVEPGTAIRIMTGALLPDGADAVAQVEITDGGREQVRITRPLRPGENVRRQGEDMRSGNVVLRDGMRLGPGEVGVLASAQVATPLVARRPTVAILSTGDELVSIGEPVLPGKVVNSNSHALAALTRESGAKPLMLGIVPDTRDATIRSLESARESDFIITSGGVSVGAFDFVKEALDALGAETKFWRVAMKPGKPVVFSRLGDTLCFGLPGNPVSCLVAFHLFVAPAIRKAMGPRDSVFAPIVRARALGRLASAGNRRAYLRVIVTADGGELVAAPMRAQGSGVSTSMVGANGLAMIEAGGGDVHEGSVVQVMLIGPVAPA